MKLAGSLLSHFMDALQCCFVAATDVGLIAFFIAFMDPFEL
jgi:hypothetical protein